MAYLPSRAGGGGGGFDVGGGGGGFEPGGGGGLAVYINHNVSFVKSYF